MDFLLEIYDNVFRSQGQPDVRPPSPQHHPDHLPPDRPLVSRILQHKLLQGILLRGKRWHLSVVSRDNEFKTILNTCTDDYAKLM